MNEERVHTKHRDSLGLIGALRSHIPQLMEKHQISGLNLAVADHGELIWEAGFGFADIARRRPMLPDSVYHSGSLGKTYTATAAMILVDRGEIAIDDAINRHLPFEVHNPLGERDITIRDLMVHGSGLGSDGAASNWMPGGSLAENLAAEYASEWSPMHGGRCIKRWTNKVGTTWTYSNLGTATLGLIVETANSDGLNFSEFVQRYIMDPLRMTHSCYPPAQHPDVVPAELWELTTCGYSRIGHVEVPTIPVFFWEYPAGGVLARPADHIRLLLAMLGEGQLDGYRLFAPSVARLMLTPAPEFGKITNALGNPVGEQGLIWRMNDWDTAWASFDHSGGHMFGWRTQGRAWPHYHAAITVAANQWSLPNDSMIVEEVTDFVGTWLRFRQPTVEESLSPEAVSYVRGALLAAAYRITFGIRGQLPNDVLNQMVASGQNRGSDWDAAAFRRGFETVTKLPPTLQAIQSFWSSPDSEVDESMVERAYAVFGGKRPSDFLSHLLPMAKSISHSGAQSTERS